MGKKVINRIVEERKKIVNQIELLLNTSSMDIASFVCNEMEKENSDSLRQAFEMLEDYRHEKELAKETGIPSIRMIKYGPCLTLLESKEMQGVYNLFVTHTENYKAMKKREMMWHAFREQVTAQIRAINTAEVLAAGNECYQYGFLSEINVPEEYQWQMKLSMTREKNSNINMDVKRPNGIWLNGTLIFCGNILSVKDGKTSIPYDCFQKSLSAKPEIAFVFEDGHIVSGSPNML